MAASYPTSSLPGQGEFARFRHALHREDQVILDDLFKAAEKHLSAAELAERALPFEKMLLCILIEQQKVLMRLAAQLEAIRTSKKPDPV